MSAWGTGIMWGIRMPDKLPKKKRGNAVVTQSDGDGTVLGIWVALPDRFGDAAALGAADMDALNGVALDHLVAHPVVGAAKETWAKFAAWVAEHEIVLPEPGLYFATVEYG